MSIVTKPLASSRESSLCKMWSSSQVLTTILRCIWRWGTLPLAHVNARWMAIAYESMKLDGCPTLCVLWKKWLSQEWNKPCHQVFGKLKTKFSSPHVLNFAEFDKPFEVHTGASDSAIGGLLIQHGWPLHMGAWRNNQLMRRSALLKDVATLFGVA